MVISKEKAFELLENVKDPEIPVLSIIDMGIVRDIAFNNEDVIVKITPTYSGCPAMQMIKDEIIKVLNNNGLNNVLVETVYSPAWTTEWMSDDAKSRLKGFGIAPPLSLRHTELFNIKYDNEAIQCPYCNSLQTKKMSEFSSTACKSIHFCNDCLQPFEYFKSI